MIHHCDRFPVPSDPAHHCYVCLNTPGQANAAGLHYTKDCSLLDPSLQRPILLFFNSILKNRHIIPRVQNVRATFTGTLDVNTVEAYYQIQPTDPKPGPQNEDPTPSDPNHRCTRCKPGSGRENFVLKHLQSDADQPPHFEMDCHQTSTGDLLEMFAVFDKTLKHMHRCPTECSEVSEELVNMVKAYYGLETPADTPIAEPSKIKQEGAPIQSVNQEEASIEPKTNCATQLGRDVGEGQDSL